MKTDAKAAEYIRKLTDKYKYILLPAVLGLLLLLWPSEDSSSQPVEKPEQLTLQVDVSDLESRLADTLTQIRGVGKVRVVLTIKSGYETVYLFNEDRTITENTSGYTDSRKSTLVRQGTGSGADPIVSKILYPVFQGALVVCQGADSSQVRLQVTEAVRALTGLAANNIVITKMKS